MRYILPIWGLLLLWSCQHNQQPTRYVRSAKTVLVFQTPVDSTRLRDEAALSAIKALSRDTAYQIEILDDYTWLDEDTLAKVSAVVFLDVLEDSVKTWQRTALERYLEAGGGMLVIDDHKVTPYLWHWYDRMLNDTIRPDSVLGPLELLQYGGGRVARNDSTAVDSLTDWQAPIAGALDFVIGENAFDPALKASPMAPEWNRFTRTVLDDDIYEPMEMVILPFGEVLFLERRGKIKLYDPALGATQVVAEMPVCTEGNYEDGLHGLALDPNYGRDNHYLYLYYSPPCDTPYQYLSRFVFENKVLELDSEIVMLKVKVQRETCCHSGGSVEFGPDGLLYLSTGDNTSSKASDGYTPIDERPGRGPYDAQKSSANTHDLRGKVLRIKPEPDGSYSIPDGNLFPKDGSSGRPEIYTMGCRNPFRITIDQRHNILYWGDVGPDVGADGRYGPQSYDEWNQARAAGYFGWPYFVGDNQAYPDRNFETDSVGLPQDPLHPVNDSPNNYGSRELPPAQPAMIWYPYGVSREFPLLGQGSRAAMAGPFYYTDDLMPLSSIKFPDYYVGKWFIYEWARSWIKVITFNEDQQPVQIEDFMPDMPLSKPIEMKFGPDGAMYLLEYGNMYFMNNPDARLVKIEFAKNNRPPVARAKADRLAGAPPLKVRFSAEESTDLDKGDSLTYAWYFEGQKQPVAGPVVDYTFFENGAYKPRLVVTDLKGAKSETSLSIEVGNTPPAISLTSPLNQTFYFEEAEVWPYQIRIADPEDELAGGIAPERAFVHFAYVSDPNYLQSLISGEAELPDGPLRYVEGARLIQNSDCYTCHHLEKENVGPAYIDVAKKYGDDAQTVERLAVKVQQGGGGVWGDRLMSAHPQLDLETTRSMVRYILSLDQADNRPLSGQFALQEHVTDLLTMIPAGEGMVRKRPGGYVLSAAYKDLGNRLAKPQTGRLVNILRFPFIQAETASEIYSGYIPSGSAGGAQNQVNLKANGYIRLNQIDLTGIRLLKLRMRNDATSVVTVHLDRPNAEPVALKALDDPSGGWNEVVLPVAVAGKHDLFLLFQAEQTYEINHGGAHIPNDLFYVDWLKFER